MKISLKRHAKQHEHSQNFSVTEYALDNDKMDMAVATISGRYPEENRVTNAISNELVYVCEGEGKIFIENQEQQISAGDVILIEPGEKYYWEGDLTLLMTCNPIWTPEQHKIVE